MIFTFVVGWITGAIIVGIIAGSRGRAAWGWLFLALMFSPLLMGILVLAMGHVRQAVGPVTHVRCTDCKEVVRRDASKCKHCGSVLTPQPYSPEAVKADRSSATAITVTTVVAMLVFLFISTMAP